jgi:anti-sigma B factor antagonist
MASNTSLLVQQIKSVTIVNFGDAAMLDSAHIDRIGQELYDLVERYNRTRLVLDFSGVRFMSSQALAVMINLRKKMDAAKGHLVICALKPELRKIFHITKLEKLFEFQPNEEKALNVFDVSGLA